MADKRIVIFSDGTWASPETEVPTNVMRMARGVCKRDGVTEQVSFYDWGVGSDGDKFAGGITGHGIDKNIMDCYRFIAHNYRPGDELYFFGFSRGAYTVRSLAGFIRNCGILKREHEDKTSDAYELYRSRPKSSNPNSDDAKKFRKDYAIEDMTKIKFVGVWDTVGALGIPASFLGSLKSGKHLFHDIEPSSIIQHARHALSIDENREDFIPAIWDEAKALEKKMDLEQVWFSGVHSDVGGGYKENGLSDCALDWMVKEAKKFDLKFEHHFIKSINPNPLDQMHNEHKGFYRLLKFTPCVRDIKPKVHSSVKKRWEANIKNYQDSDALSKLMGNSAWANIKIIP